MTRLFLFTAMLLAAPLSALADPPAIPEIHNPQELRDCKTIAAGKDWDIRVGISDAGEDAGPWKLIYCLAESKREAAPPSDIERGNPIGPVFFTCRYGDPKIQEGASKVSRSTKLVKPGNPQLYCDVIPLAWKGTCHVKIISASGEVLAVKDIEVEKPRPCYWSYFAALSKAPGGYPCVIRAQTCAAIFGFAEPVPPGDLLPGAFPADGKFPLALTLKDGVFNIHSEGQKLLDWPDAKVLARWWVNDKLVEAPREVQKSISYGRVVSTSFDLNVTAGLPDYLGELHVGDSVGVQALYSPADALNIAPTSDASMMMKVSGWSSDEPAIPLQSNRLDFKVTPQLLAGRSAATRPSP